MSNTGSCLEQREQKAGYFQIRISLNQNNRVASTQRLCSVFLEGGWRLFGQPVQHSYPEHTPFVGRGLPTEPLREGGAPRAGIVRGDSAGEVYEKRRVLAKTRAPVQPLFFCSSA